jgi:hypothetical protein
VVLFRVGKHAEFRNEALVFINARDASKLQVSAVHVVLLSYNRRAGIRMTASLTGRCSEVTAVHPILVLRQDGPAVLVQKQRPDAPRVAPRHKGLAPDRGD